MKPGLDELCIRHRIGFYTLSGISRLDERATTALLLGFTVTREVVAQALMAINRITGQAYAIEDVQVSLQDSPVMCRTESASDENGEVQADAAGGEMEKKNVNLVRGEEHEKRVAS